MPIEHYGRIPVYLCAYKEKVVPYNRQNIIKLTENLHNISLILTTADPSLTSVVPWKLAHIDWSIAAPSHQHQWMALPVAHDRTFQYSIHVHFGHAAEHWTTLSKWMELLAGIILTQSSTFSFIGSPSQVLQQCQKWFMMLPLHCCNLFIFFTLPACSRIGVFVSHFTYRHSIRHTLANAFLIFLDLCQTSKEWTMPGCFVAGSKHQCKQ